MMIRKAIGQVASLQKPTYIGRVIPVYFINKAKWDYDQQILEGTFPTRSADNDDNKDDDEDNNKKKSRFIPSA